MNEKLVFNTARKIADEAARDEYLKAVCGDDFDALNRIRELLNEDSDDSSFLEPPSIAPTATRSLDAEPSRLGQQIGPYKLLQEIGEGGMGVVYMAEQTHPVKRRVALKIIKPGMDSKQVIARFEAERQALAMMDHPNIAKVLDAGTTKHGRPYFVMELVNGVPITRYCDGKHYSTRERLELFLPVCQAVQHAHQKGIIHRDLKPTNILVAQYDDQAVPKVIDFGVAKATSQNLTEKTLFTQFGQVIGTLEYMSPEQAQRNQLDIDTRSDIFSLGVVLYELLTGATPFDRIRLRAAALDEVLRIIREEDPPTPSHRLSSIETLPSIAANRQVDPNKLGMLLRGELDWIVMKALEKDRTRRYETANGFAMDISRYLTDEAVQACPPSTTYRLKKFARKHKQLLGTLSLVAATLLLATCVSIWLAIWAFRAEKASSRLAIEKTELAGKNAALAASERQQRMRAETEKALAKRNQYIAHMQQVRLEWNNNRVGRVLELLEKYRTPKKGEIDLRGWEWYYWDRMCHLDLRTLEGHEGPVNSVAFSHDGSWIASGGDDGTVRIWRSTTGELIRTLAAHRGQVTSVAFHPTDSRLASAGVDKQVLIWDAVVGTKLAAMEHEGIVSCLAFDQSGGFLATATSSPVNPKFEYTRNVWDLSNAERKHRFVGRSRVQSVLFSKDDTQLICAATPAIEVWELAAGTKTERQLHGDLGDNNLSFKPALDLALSVDGLEVFSAAEDGTAKVWSLGEGKELRRFSNHDQIVTSIDVHPNRKLAVSGSADQTIRVWRTLTGDEELVLRGHTGPVTDVAFSPDGFRIASSSRDGTIKIWDSAASMDARYVLVEDFGHFLNMKFQANSSQLAYARFSGRGDETTQWAAVQDMAAQERLKKIEKGHDSSIRAVTLSPNGSLIATGGGTRVLIREFPSGRTVHRFDELKHVVNDGLVFSANNELLMVKGRQFDPDKQELVYECRVYDVETADLLHTITNRCVALSPVGNVIAACEPDSEISILDARTGSYISKLPAGHKTMSLLFSDDGAFVGAVSENEMIIWQISSGTEQVHIRGAGKCLAIDSEAERVFTMPDRETLKIWDLVSGDETCSISAPMRSVFSTVSLSSDRDLIAFSALPYLMLLDLRPNTVELSIERESEALAAQLLSYPLSDTPWVVVPRTEILLQLQGLNCVTEAIKTRCAQLIQRVFTNYAAGLQYGQAAAYLLDGADAHEPGLQNAEKLATPEQLQEALEYSERALELLPDDPLIKAVRGAVLCDAGRHEESIPFLEIAYAERARFDARMGAMFLAFQAKAKLHLGLIEEAQDLLEKAKADEGARQPDAIKQIKIVESLLANSLSKPNKTN